MIKGDFAKKSSLKELFVFPPPIKYRFYISSIILFQKNTVFEKDQIYATLEAIIK